MAKKTAAKKTDTKVTVPPMARNLWLAGLGVYGAAYDEAMKRSEGSRKRVEELFDTFITKGEKVEEQTLETVKKARENVEKARETANTNFEEGVEKLRSIKLEDEVEKLRDSFKLPFSTKSDRVEELEAEVAALSKKVSALSRTPRAKAAPKAPKTAAKKAA